MKIWFGSVVVLVMLLGPQSTTASPVLHSRRLTAKAQASAKAIAIGKGSSASSFSQAVAEGNNEAIASALTNALKGGTAESAAGALAEAVQNEDANITAVAQAVAEAIGTSPQQIEDALAEGDTETLAQAIAQSSGGEASAASKASSLVKTESRDSIFTAVVEMFTNVSAGGDPEAAAFVAAEAIGEAFAFALSEASVQLRITGSGFASGRAETAARAVATTSVLAIGEAIANATNKFTLASARVKGSAAISAIATAATSAIAEGDLFGAGEVAAIERSIAAAVAKPVATVMGEALAISFEGESETSTFVEAVTNIDEDVNAESTTDVATQGIGSGDASGTATAATDVENDNAVVNTTATVTNTPEEEQQDSKKKSKREKPAPPPVQPCGGSVAACCRLSSSAQGCACFRKNKDCRFVKQQAKGKKGKSKKSKKSKKKPEGPVIWVDVRTKRTCGCF